MFSLVLSFYNQPAREYSYYTYFSKWNHRTVGPELDVWNFWRFIAHEHGRQTRVSSCAAFQNERHYTAKEFGILGGGEGRDFASQNSWRNLGLRKITLVTKKVFWFSRENPESRWGHTRIQLGNIPERARSWWARNLKYRTSNSATITRSPQWNNSQPKYTLRLPFFCLFFPWEQLPPSLVDRKIRLTFSTKVQPYPFST